STHDYEGLVLCTTTSDSIRVVSSQVPCWVGCPVPARAPITERCSVLSYCLRPALPLRRCVGSPLPLAREGGPVSDPGVDRAAPPLRQGPAVEAWAQGHDRTSRQTAAFGSAASMAAELPTTSALSASS